MTALILDPWVLSFDGRVGVDTYIQRLLDIYDVNSEGVIDLQITASAAELLEGDGSFPLNGDIHANLWPRRQDVFRVVAGIIDKVPKLEDASISSAVHYGVSLSRPLVIGGAQATYIEDLLALLAVRASNNVKSSVLTDALGGRCHVVVQATVDMYEIAGEIVCLNSAVLEQDVSVGGDLFGFFRQLSHLDFALDGRLKEAVSLALWLNAPEQTGAPFGADGWALGSSFESSAVACGLTVNPGRMASALRTMVSIVAGTNLRASHALRVGRGPNEAQKTHSVTGARAWRADIDDELHIHYWASSGSIVFSNVVFHNDFSIFE